MAFASHPRYTQIMNILNTVLSGIATRQTAFLAANGRYFQGIKILRESKLNGMTNTTADWTVHPTDHSHSWTDFSGTVFKASLQMPVHISLNVYRTPAGEWGWIFVVDLWYAGIGPDAYGHDGDHWVYQHHAGPEAKTGIWDEWFIHIPWRG